MRESTISATEARVRFGELLLQVARDNRPVIVEKGGKPAAVVISVRVYEEMRDKLASAAGDPIEEALVLGQRVRERRGGETLPPPRGDPAGAQGGTPCQLTPSV